MGEYKIVTCNSWQDFKSTSISELFKGEPFARSVYLFRGHTSARWSLMSSFDRRYIGKSRRDRANMAEELIKKFKREAEGLDVAAHIWEDSVARLALAQHYGVPTRLLDWTESPYIAAFFAFAGIDKRPAPEDHVAIWCLDTRSDIWSAETGVEVLEVPSYGNDRLRSQLGKFTYLKAPFDTLEEYVITFEEEDNALIQFQIPSTEALVALADLDVMGINYPRLFAGLEGCARAASLHMLIKYKFIESAPPKEVPPAVAEALPLPADAGGG